MDWYLSNTTDPEVRPLADRHYSRQKIGSRRFVPPGRALVLKTQPVDAYWVTSWPFAEFVKHEWAGAFICTAFRNEGKLLSSDLIKQAVSATIWKYPDIPELGMITFVDMQKIRRGNPGYCFQMAGFRKVGKTKVRGLIALQLLRNDFPKKHEPNNCIKGLF